MAKVRNIYKQPATMEDLAQGVGEVTQTRGGNSVTVHKIDVPFAVNSEAELKVLDANVYTSARVYSSVNEYIDYVYDPAAAVGISPDSPLTTGFWVEKSNASVKNKLNTDELSNYSTYDFTTVDQAKLGVTVGGKQVSFKLNDRVRTIGLSSTSDGKGAEYLVVGSGTGVADDFHFHDTAFGLQLQLINSGTINLSGYEVLDLNSPYPFTFESEYTPPSGTVFGIVHTGQSLAEGGVGGDSVSGVNSASFPDRVLMFDPKPVGLSNDVLNSNPIDLVEPSRVTIAHSLTRNIATGNDNTYLFSGQAWGGQPYSALKKGGSTGVYEKVIDQVNDATIAFSGIEYIGVSVIHGEQDGINNNTTYAADLNQWQTDFDADIKAKTGQVSNVTMFICQTSTAGGYGFNGGINELTFPTPLEQLEAHETYSDIVLVAPKYFLEYADHSHIKNISQRILGEYYAKAFKQGSAYEPLRPSTITPSGNSVIIDFVGNIGALAFDTTLVNSVADMGFSYKDDSANTITGVAITGTNQVTVTLSGTVGLNAVVAYAYHNGAGGSANQVAGNGDRGNLRDSDTAVSLYNGDPLYNWAVTFRKAVN